MNELFGNSGNNTKVNQETGMSFRVQKQFRLQNSESFCQSQVTKERPHTQCVTTKK